MTTRHLVTVWNPAYAADAMEGHQRILRAAAEACREKQCDEDDVYVWWAKLRSSNRLKPLPHLDEILAIGAAQCGDEPDAETHLYLTDYRTLYVAHVAQITADDPRKDPAEHARIPAYYLADGRVADFWFRLWDIRRMVQDFNMDLEIVGMPIVREADGLALSSRNAKLDAAGRASALCLSRAIAAARGAFRGGERSVNELRRVALALIQGERLAELDYLEFRDPTTLVPLQQADGSTLLALAVRIGAVRLIDNCILGEE